MPISFPLKKMFFCFEENFLFAKKVEVVFVEDENLVLLANKMVIQNTIGVKGVNWIQSSLSFTKLSQQKFIGTINCNNFFWK